MKNFVYQTQPSRVVFGVDALNELVSEVEKLGARKAIVLSTPDQEKQAKMIADMLGEKAAGIYPFAVMHVPIEVAREAREFAKKVGADCAIAIGGGSTIGLGKAIALESPLPILAIPTTYAGSEMTPIYGLTEGGLKKTGRDNVVLPKTVIYDPNLSRTLPVGLSVTSGMNAIAHAVEALYAQDSNPIIDLMSEDGIRALGQAIPAIVKDANDMEARSQALYGAWLCGYALGNVGMSLHHKLCHTLGGSFNLPHAEVHTVVLPQAMLFNARHAKTAMAKICRALGVSNAPQGVFDLAKNNGAPFALKDIGMKYEDLDKAAEIAVTNSYWNPRPIGKEQLKEIRELLECAYHGVRPE